MTITINYFQKQANIKNKAFVLIFIFCCTVIVTGLIVGLAHSGLVLLIINAGLAHLNIQYEMSIYHFICVSIIVIPITILIIALMINSRIKMQQQKGGFGIAEQLGAKAISRNSEEYFIKRLNNIVEEIAIAAGTTVPHIYVLENEESINAFAAGYTTADAAIVVTDGALKLLNRSELEGVIGHEFSHILNGDMRLNTIMMAWLFGIMMFYYEGKFLLRGYGTGNIILGCILVFLDSFGIIICTLIKTYINRDREYFADLTAVRLSRQTEGILGALKKIAALPINPIIQNPLLEKVSHMTFSDAFFTKWISTHPNIYKRIQAIDPHFNMQELNDLRAQWKKQLPDGKTEDLTKGLKAADTSTLHARINASLAIMSFDTSAIGALHDANCEASKTTINLIPAFLTQSARQLENCTALVISLLYSKNSETLQKQLTFIQENYGEQEVAKSQKFFLQTNLLNKKFYLPLTTLCIPGLRHREMNDVIRLQNTINALINNDDKSLFKYCLGYFISNNLQDYIHPKIGNNFGVNTLDQVSLQINILFSILAQACHSSENTKNAYITGMSYVLPNSQLEFQIYSSFANTLNSIWESFDKLEPLQKKRLIEGISLVLKTSEPDLDNAELLRIICAFLHCPMPLI